MNKQLALLMKIYFLGQFRIHDIKSGNEKVRKHAMGMMVLLIILVPLFCVYSGGLASGLCYVGLAGVIPSYAITIVALITIAFTMLKAGSVLFDFKDYEMLTALPIKTDTIVQSRFFMMYVLNLTVSLIVMIPMGVVYAVSEKPDFLFYPMWVIGTIFATLIPTTIAAILGAIIVAFSSRFRYTNILATVLTFLFVFAVFGSSILLGQDEQQLSSIQSMNAIGDMIYEQMCALYPVAGFFSDAVVEQNVISFLLYILLSVCGYAVFVWILAKNFRKINSNLKGHFAKSDFQMRSLNTSSKFFALFKKEWKRFAGSSVYITNIGMGVVMAGGFAIACGVVGVEKLADLLNMPGAKESIIGTAPFLFSAMLGMSCMTSVSLSLEGKHLWILQSLPISVEEIIRVKIAANISLLLPVAILGGGFMAVRIPSDLGTGVLYLVLPVIYAVFVPVYGMFINLKMQNYEWESEVTVVKQSIASMLGMLGSLVFAILPMPFIILNIGGGPQMITWIFSAIVLLLTAVFYLNIRRVKRLG